MTTQQPALFDPPGALAPWPPLGAWVHVRTNTGDTDGSFLGCVVRHYAKPPDFPALIYVVNRTGAIEAAPAEIAAVHTVQEVALWMGLDAAEIERRTAGYLAEYATGQPQ